MSFDLPTLFIFIGLGLLYRRLLSAHVQRWALLVGSVVAVYWLQPALPIRYSDFIFPSLTLALTISLWWLTRHPEQTLTKQDKQTFLVIASVVLLLSLNRFLPAEWRLTPSRPPNPLYILLAIAGLALVFRLPRGRWIYPAGTTLILLIFLILKTEPLALALSGGWRTLTGRDPTLASTLDLTWLGYSYIAFRLIHTLRDRQTGLLPALTLRDYTTYTLFFPALIAGPIDRAERFLEDLNNITDGRRKTEDGHAPTYLHAFTRIATGLFKKFIIADTLAQGLSLNTININQVTSTNWLWVLLYGYALRLFFDFAGYSDIAIGLGQLFGITLPENFNRPYLQTNLTKFWQSWHITLSNWARFYVFSPLSRWLLKRKPRPAPILIVLTTQVATMVTIGLWHGVTGNFLIWGVWHGLGLWVHKQWSDRTRKWYRNLKKHPGRFRIWSGLTWFITFHYVVIGWVWFLLPDTPQAIQTILLLFGLR